MTIPSPPQYTPHTLWDRPAPSNGQTAGAALRDQAHARHEQHRSTYLLRARRVLLTTLIDQETATADDVQALAPLPDWIDRTAYGAVPTPLARAGIITRAGYVPSRRPEAHARPVSVWSLLDREAALQWLAHHPERGEG